MKLQETVAAHLRTVPSSSARVIDSSARVRYGWLRVPPNPGLKLWSSSLHYGAGKKEWNVPPEAAKRTETHIKFFTLKTKRRESQSNRQSPDWADSAGSMSLCKIKMEKKVEERITPFLLSVANVNTPAPTLLVREKGKGKSRQV